MKIELKAVKIKSFFYWQSPTHKHVVGVELTMWPYIPVRILTSAEIWMWEMGLVWCSELYREWNGKKRIQDQRRRTVFETIWLNLWDLAAAPAIHPSQHLIIQYINKNQSKLLKAKNGIHTRRERSLESKETLLNIAFLSTPTNNGGNERKGNQLILVLIKIKGGKLEVIV